MLLEIAPFLAILPSTAYSLICLFSARTFFKEASAQSGYLPPVTVLKPVKGMDADSLENFSSFCLQEYPAYQIIFAAASEDDPVLPVIELLRAKFPEVDITLVVDERKYGSNHKVCNLINAYPHARYDILIVCDSDIRVDAGYLRNVCAHFSDPEVGLVTSLYRSTNIHGPATAIEALGFTTEMVPNVMTALRLEVLSFALGASMAVRREALEKIGGFGALVDYLADDYQLGNMVHNAGYRLVLSRHFVESVMKRETLRGVLSRQLRWARTMRASRPWGYLASGITQPAPGAVLALALSAFSLSGLWAFLMLACVRAGCSILFSRVYVRDRLLPRRLWLLPLRDLFSFGTWALSFLGNRVVWRGSAFRVMRGGKMVKDI